MERDTKESNQNVVDFLRIVKKAYDKGTNEHEITLEKLVDDIEADLRKLVF